MLPSCVPPFGLTNQQPVSLGPCSAHMLLLPGLKDELQSGAKKNAAGHGHVAVCLSPMREVAGR